MSEREKQKRNGSSNPEGIGNMKKTVTGLFDGYESAEHASEILRRGGFAEEEISVVAQSQIVQERLGDDETQRALEGAGAGALGGAAIGGFAGLLAGAVTLVLPGVGPVLAGGAVATAAGASAAGAGIGAAYGGFAGTLIGLGMSEQKAHLYVEGVKRGNVLLIVETTETQAWKALNAMYQGGALEAQDWAGTWKAEEAAPPIEIDSSDLSEEERQQTLERLDSLIEGCEDGYESFQVAAENVRDPDLSQLFDEFSVQYQLFAARLRPYVAQLGGHPEESGTLSGAARRGWVNIKATMTIQEENTQRVVLSAVQDGVLSVMNKYRETLNAGLPAPIRSVVEQQYEEIRVGYRRLMDIDPNTQ
jgi:uncharacterized protein (TIGR02284 family)